MIFFSKQKIINTNKTNLYNSNKCIELCLLRIKLLLELLVQWLRVQAIGDQILFALVFHRTIVELIITDCL